MAQFFELHPDNPQPRLIKQAVEMLRAGKIMVYPTDSAYALGCTLQNKSALERICEIRQLDEDHHMTLMCQNLSQLGAYAILNDNSAFRFLKSHIPGPFTFLLKASQEVPKRLMHFKRKTIGLRIPDNKITQALLEELGEPLMSTSLILPGETDPLFDPHEIRDHLEHRVDLIIDGGFCGIEPTTVVDLFDNVPHIIRQGKGIIE